MEVRRALVVLLVFAGSCTAACAHEVRPAYLELTQTAPHAFDVLWKVPAMGGNLRLGLYVRFPESCELDADPTGVFAGNAYVERSSVREPKALVGSTITIDGLQTTLTDVLVRIERLDGATQVARLMPESPSLVVEASPSSWQVARTYFVLGVEHILMGIDHLLFVLALVLLVKGWNRLVGTITAFTVAHSITLALATLGFVNIPGPPVEACIALSIVFVAAEIVRSRQGRPGLTEQAPWLIAFTFGLLHGLGFAGALSDVGLPQQAIPLALLFFNVGVEVGQLAFVAACLLAIAVLRALPTALRDGGGWLAPYAIGSVAMFWVIERTSGFWP
ncbi:MAG: HupE/UreJ family protein [Planctomycetota bacterium]